MSKPPSEFDQRATFYFSEDQLHELEVVMLQLRTEHRLKIGKSEIMRFGLGQVFAQAATPEARAELAKKLKEAIDAETSHE